MCGISGSFKAAVTLSQIEIACETMFHRGPDSGGFYSKEGANFGIRRLSIIDLGGGDQPIFNRDRTVCIIFNGEIFNYQELRRELEKLGYAFTTNSDTETILHAYEEWGEAAPEHLRGQFAFAIHDLRPRVVAEQGENGRLFIARDRLGIKPLYYSPLEDGLVFASEVKVLLRSGLAAPRLNRVSLRRYLQWGFVPGPETIIENVRLLPAAHSLTLDRQGLRLNRYWSLNYTEDLAYGQDYESTARELREKLENAVEAEMIADVPVGAFLSGGMDSSTVVALMARVMQKQGKKQELHTFSISFNEAHYNEIPFAELIARKYGTTHYNSLVSVRDVLEELPGFIWSMDQPSVDGLNTYFVSRFVHREGLKVALSGLGGDEIFGGYPSFYYLPRTSQAVRKAAKVPGLLPWARAATRTRQYSGRRRKLYESFNTSGRIGELYAVQRGLFLGEDSQNMLDPAFSGEPEPSRLLAETLNKVPWPDGRTSRWNQVSLLEQSLYMNDQLLRDTDCMSMAHSLEVRVPLTDYHLVEFMATVPEKFKQSARRVKPLLARATADLLPQEIQDRPKRGFSFPIGEWMRRELRPEMENILLDLSNPLFNQPEVKQVWHEFLEGRCHYSRPWSLAVLSLWLESHKVQL